MHPLYVTWAVLTRSNICWAMGGHFHAGQNLGPHVTPHHLPHGNVANQGNNFGGNVANWSCTCH